MLARSSSTMAASSRPAPDSMASARSSAHRRTARRRRPWRAASSMRTWESALRARWVRTWPTVQPASKLGPTAVVESVDRGEEPCMCGPALGHGRLDVDETDIFGVPPQHPQPGSSTPSSTIDPGRSFGRVTNSMIPPASRRSPSASPSAPAVAAESTTLEPGHRRPHRPLGRRLRPPHLAEDLGDDRQHAVDLAASARPPRRAAGGNSSAAGPRGPVDRALVPPRPHLFGDEGHEGGEQPQQSTDRARPSAARAEAGPAAAGSS